MSSQYFYQAGHNANYTGGTVTTLACTLSAKQRPGDLLYALVSWFGTGSTATVTDSAGNAWTAALDTNSDTNGVKCSQFAVLPIKAAAAGGTVTAHFSGAGVTFPAISVGEWGPLVTALDKHTGQAGAASTNLTSGATAATTDANEIVIGGMYSDANAGMAAGAGFNSLDIEPNSDQLLEDKLVNAKGPQTATATANNDVWNAFVATFRVMPQDPMGFGAAA